MSKPNMSSCVQISALTHSRRVGLKSAMDIHFPVCGNSQASMPAAVDLYSDPCTATLGDVNAS
eukprot:5654685-Amphidinium_carterae.2